MTVEQEIAVFIREIMRRKIQTPRPDQHVARCHFSKTGWAIWNCDGICTCVPARKPEATE